MLQSVECRVQGPLIHLQNVPRNLLDPFGDRPTMQWLGLEGPQDEQIERALQKVQCGSWRHDVERRHYASWCRMSTTSEILRGAGQPPLVHPNSAVSSAPPRSRVDGPSVSSPVAIFRNCRNKSGATPQHLRSSGPMCAHGSDIRQMRADLAGFVRTEISRRAIPDAPRAAGVADSHTAGRSAVVTSAAAGRRV